VPVALGIVVVGVDDDLASQRLDGNAFVGLQRDRAHQDVTRLGGLLAGPGGRERPQFVGQAAPGHG